MAGTFGGRFVPPFSPLAANTPVGVATDTPPYDPIALADYIEKQRRLGRTPLFTDDARLAAKEDGFFISTGSARAAATAGQPGVTFGTPTKSLDIPETGIPLVDQARKEQFDLVQKKQQLEGAYQAAIKGLPETQAVERLTTKLSMSNNMLLGTPEERNNLLTQVKVATALAGAAAEKLKLDKFGNQYNQLALEEAALTPKLADAEALLKTKQDVTGKLSLVDAANAKDVTISKNAALMAGTAQDPISVATAVREGTITPAMQQVAVDIAHGLDSSTATYYGQGKFEEGLAKARYVVATTPEPDRPAVKVASDAMEGAYKKAQLGVQQELMDPKSEASKVLTAATAGATSKESKDQATLEALNKQILVKYQQNLGAVKSQVLSENTELLRPETTWTAQEAEIGNQLVKLIQANEKPDLASKLQDAVAEVFDSAAGQDTALMSSVIRKVGLAYQKRFNERYGKLGLVASPADLQGLEIGLLQRVLPNVIIAGRDRFPGLPTIGIPTDVISRMNARTNAAYTNTTAQDLQMTPTANWSFWPKKATP